MGRTFADRYSLLHFATGVIAKFWGVDVTHWFLAHLAFELIENTSFGMGIINRLPFWPGGKDHADAVVNILGDTVFAMLGYYFAGCFAL